MALCYLVSVRDHNILPVDATYITKMESNIFLYHFIWLIYSFKLVAYARFHFKNHVLFYLMIKDYF